LFFISFHQILSNPNCLSIADELWLGPGPNSVDMPQLFLDTSQWPNTFKALTSFQFFAQQLLYGNCDICGANNITTWKNIDAIKKLTQWGKSIAVEIGSLKEYDCNATLDIQPALDVAKNVKDLGGSVNSFAMDEPLISAIDKCKLNMQTAAVNVNNWMNVVRKNTNARIGDVEPYPFFSADQLCQWIKVLHQTNGPNPIAFFHLDIDFNAVKNLQKAIHDINQIKGCSDALGISFGGIINAFPVKTNNQYATLSLKHLDAYKKAVGRLSHVIFESWNPNMIPSNLPESDSNTHTGLIKSGCSLG